MNDAQIKHMVNRFLSWKLPNDFRPDAGISFKAEFNENTPFPMKHEPSGTNLFNADQAERMVRHLLEGLPLQHNVTGTEGRQGDWMQTVTGRQFWPIDPRPEDINIEDIAHALSMMCRFGGHCDRFYSVAEHSVLVSENVPPQDALWGLLHDASEAYIADIVRPAKRFIIGYKDIEGRIMAAVCGAFDLPYIEPPSVKRADNAILADEAAQIMGAKPKDWILPEPPLGVRIIGLSPTDAKAAFLTRYRALTTMEGQDNG